MKQQAVILVLPVFYQNLPVSAILVQILINTSKNKNCLWQPCLLTDRDEMSIPYRGPSINASYQVLAQLAKQFQGRRFLEIDQI
jgi:hypothetical protein